MTSICLIIAALTLVGHLWSILRAKTYWPFDYYPMYSVPLRRQRYPLVRGNKLIMYSLFDSSVPGQEKDLLSGARIYPKMFHPFDKLETVLLLIKAGLLEPHGSENSFVGSYIVNSNENLNHERSARLRHVMEKLGKLALKNGVAIAKLSLVRMEWNDFRRYQSNPLVPDVRSVVEELVFEQRA